MPAQVALSRLQYWTSLKKLNMNLLELNNSMSRLAGYDSYVKSHTNMLTPKISFDIKQ